MPEIDKSHALDHVVVVLFENRSLDNVLGHLYGPDDGKDFDGVIGKNLNNPIPVWAQHGAERWVVPYKFKDPARVEVLGSRAIVKCVVAQDESAIATSGCSFDWTASGS